MFRPWLPVLAALILQACNDAPDTQRAVSGETLADSAADSADASRAPRHARGYAWSASPQGEDYAILHIFPRLDQGGDSLRFALVPRGRPKPEAFPPERIIRTPVRRAVLLSTTQAGMLARLNQRAVIVGMDAPERLYDEALRRRATAGQIEAVAAGGGEVNPEAVAALRPGVVLASAVPELSRNLAQLRQLGIPVLPFAEWQETSPLARAEWLRLMGRLVGRSGRADSLFRRMETRYRRLSERVQAAEQAQRPVVLEGLPFKGTWYVSGGESYAAKLLAAAGAHHPWDSTESTGSLPLDFEAVYPVGRRAGIWLRPGAMHSLAELAEQDARFRDFPSWQQGRVYNTTALEKPGGANAYWERGVIDPATVLADLVHICHPELLPEHQLVYYERLQ